MSGLSTATKGMVGLKAGKATAKRPQVLRAGAKGALKLAGAKAALKAAGPVSKGGAKAARPLAKAGAAVGKPLLKRKLRRRARRFGETASAVTSTLITYAPDAARQLGLVIEEPPRKRTTPRVAVGVVIGATGMYFLEPGPGAQRRQKLMQLVR